MLFIKQTNLNKSVAINDQMFSTLNCISETEKQFWINKLQLRKKVLNGEHRQSELWKWKFNCSSANVNIKYCIKDIKKKNIKNTLILKIKMQLLCILSKSHFWFGIKWKDYALQHLEESICIFGPIDYRLLKTDRNLKELSVYTLSIFWIHFILHRPTLTASANTAPACKCKCHLSGITGPGLCCLIQAQCTHRSTPAALGSSLLKCHLYFTAELHKNCEIYSMSATPLRLAMSLLSLRQPPFRHGSTAAMPYIYTCTFLTFSCSPADPGAVRKGCI